MKECKRIEIEEVENGYTIKTWERTEDAKDEYGYEEPVEQVAKDLKEVLTLVAQNLQPDSATEEQGEG